MSSTAPKPTAAELDLLRTLWRIGPASAKQTHEALSAERPELNEATVLRQLQLMHTKGLLKRDEGQRPHVYAPVHAQDHLQTQMLKDLVSKVFAGSGKDLVMAALRTQVSKKERAEIAKLLEGDKS